MSLQVVAGHAAAVTHVVPAHAHGQTQQAQQRRLNGRHLLEGRGRGAGRQAGTAVGLAPGHARASCNTALEPRRSWPEPLPCSKQTGRLGVLLPHSGQDCGEVQQT